MLFSYAPPGPDDVLNQGELPGAINVISTREDLIERLMHMVQTSFACVPHYYYMQMQDMNALINAFLANSPDDTRWVEDEFQRRLEVFFGECCIRRGRPFFHERPGRYVEDVNFFRSCAFWRNYRSMRIATVYPIIQQA